MRIKSTLQKFYYEMTLAELRRMAKSRMLPKLSYASLLYLDLIEMTPECTASRLAEILGISKPAITVKINELLRRGLIRKRRSDEDRRVYYIEVQPETVEEYQPYDMALKRGLSAVIRKFRPNDVEMFCRILETFGDGFNSEIVDE